jgi:hypothetical protein
VVAVDAEHVFEVAATDDQEVVEAVGANGAHPALGVGVRVRSLYRRADHADAFAAEDLVEGVGELRVAIMDQEPKRSLFADVHDQVEGLLGDPGVVGVRGAGEVLDPPGCERDEEQHVDPLQERGLDRQEDGMWRGQSGGPWTIAGSLSSSLEVGHDDRWWFGSSPSADHVRLPGLRERRGLRRSRRTR